MPGFIPPFETTTVQSVQAVTIVLPDNEVVLDHAMTRPGLARFANSPLALCKVQTSAPQQIICSAVATIRKIVLDAAFMGNATLIADDINELFEITALPFFTEQVLRSLPGGLPVFYIGIPTAAQESIEEDDLIIQGRPLGESAVFYFAALLQDRVCLEPWGWGIKLQQALTAAGEDGSIWTNFINAIYPVNNTRIIKVLDQIGEPFGVSSFTVTINGQTQNINSDADSILNLSSTAGQAIELKWLGNPKPGEAEALTVMSLYEANNSAAPRNALSLPADFIRGHLQLFELANWFCNPNTGSALQRFHTRSKVEPLTDGFKTFKLMADDMINCVPRESDPNPPNGDKPGAHFAGWGFKEFVMDDELLDDDGKPFTYAGLVKHLVDNRSDVRALVNKLFSVPGDLDNAAQQNAILLVVILTDIVLIASITGVVETNAPGKIVLMGSQILAPLGALLLDDVNKMLEDAMDQSKEMFPKFNEIKPLIAIRSVHPCLLEDNPLFTPVTVPTPIPVTITDFINGSNTWHQKFQLFKRAASRLDPLGNRFVAYVGGMDVNGNRLDNFGRQGNSPYHDVHARVTGPAASDLFKSWQERYEYERGLPSNPDTLERIFDAPEPTDLPVNDNAKHIIQVSRTLFRPATPNAQHALPFARNGDVSIGKNLLRGIQEAKEYIYLADQYFVPNETTNGQPAYLNALLDAADHCKRLIVVSPSIMTLADIPFGHERRADVVSRLLARWGSRAIIGAPIRRPVLPSPGKLTHEGRCILYAAATGLDEFIKIGPKARLPKSLPFWIWINGELMLATQLTDEGELIDGHPVVKLKVIRGAVGVNVRWGATTRAHPKGSAVTCSQLRGIFVHDKNMIVDDVFVYIGSGNINRRGFYSDGEIGVFAVPEQLKAALDNPARMLRTDIWAEHLNLPPSMGEPLLQDPIAAFELFRRHLFGGNRLMPLSTFDLNDDADLQFSINSNLLLNALSNLGMGWFTSVRDKIYNTIVDPTTIDDPQPTPGP
jgi:phosphatidylserine/phosphatidylglycerophosphate/cardiolipin synthase-like enzyme